MKQTKNPCTDCARDCGSGYCTYWQTFIRRAWTELQRAFGKTPSMTEEEIENAKIIKL